MFAGQNEPSGLRCHSRQAVPRRFTGARRQPLSATVPPALTRASPPESVPTELAPARWDELRLRVQRRTDWAGWVLDLDKPAMISPTSPLVGWERVYFVEGRD